MELRLEPLGPAHLEGFADVLNDPDVLRFTRVPDPPPEGFAADWARRYAEADDGRRAWAAIGEDGAFLGLGLAPQVNREGRELELGYLVAPQARGRGVATEILRRLTDWAFGEWGALRVWLVIDAENPASRAVAERCGYEHEGTLRSSHLKQGRRIDAEIWARLA